MQDERSSRETPPTDEAHGEPRDDSRSERATSTFEHLLGSTRVIILLGALASLLASIALLSATVVAVVDTIWDQIFHEDADSRGVKTLSVEFIELTDAVLLGTVFYIIALGLFELFFDQDLPVPAWLRFRNLSELKESLIEVVIVLLGVIFLGRAVTWTGDTSIIQFGLAIAGVIFALGAVLLVGHIRHGNEHD